MCINYINDIQIDILYYINNIYNYYCNIHTVFDIWSRKHLSLPLSSIVSPSWAVM